MPENAETVPVGQPISNSTCHVLDRGRRLVPLGVPGELYVGGLGLARGYLNDPELTAQRFIDDPFQPGERLYRTGDRVRRQRNGNLEFLGRLDHQVKLRGHRIELGEIEAILSEHRCVAQCAVVLRKDGCDEPRLTAYWVPRESAETTVAALRNHLRNKLPDPMVPATFVRLPALPLTASGKLDRLALPRPEVAQTESECIGQLPRTALEQTLAAIWSRLLGPEQPSVDDNFFDVGGNSLLAVRLVAEIEKACGAPISVATLFSHPSIARLAEALETIGTRSSIVEIRRGGSSAPLYFLPGLLGETFNCMAILEELASSQPVYAIAARPGEDRAPGPSRKW